jgi:hypothetical protein
MAEFRPFLLPFEVKSLWTANFAKLAQSSQTAPKILTITFQLVPCICRGAGSRGTEIVEQCPKYGKKEKKFSQMHLKQGNPFPVTKGR